MFALVVAGCGKPTPLPDASAADVDPPAPEQEVSQAPPDIAAPPDAPAVPPKPKGLAAGTVVTGGASPEELAAVRANWKPELPPDKRDVVPAAGLDVMSQAKQNEVRVDRAGLRFKAADHPDVLTWEKGKVLVSAPADKGAKGSNPFGFARKVVRVEQVGDEVVVTTAPAALQEIMHGDLQLEFDITTATDVEWAAFEADAAWAAEALYVNSLPTIDHLPDGLRDDTPPANAAPPTGNGDPFCCFIDDAVDFVSDKVGSAVNTVVGVAKAVGGAVVDAAAAVGGTVVSGATAAGRTVTSISKAIYEEARDLYEKIMPKSFSGEATLAPEFKTDAIDLSIVKYDVTKVFNESGDLPVAASFKADSNLKGSLSFTPKLSVGAQIPNPIAIGELPPLRVWLDVDAALMAKLTLDLKLEAAITSAGGKAGSKLEEALNTAADFAGPVLNAFRKEVFGSKDVKPAGNWKKTIFLSKPRVQTILLGKLPVVLTATFQVDVDCGFELKAQLEADATVESVHTFRYRAEYQEGVGMTQQKPTYEHKPRTEVRVLGGGEASITCGVIPRINVFLYDTIGINAGIRGSVVARASYESSCSAESTAPSGEVALSLSANIGIPVGARIQAPGSSFAGKDGLDAGFDVGPLEIWNKEFDIVKGKWDVPGLGYCTPTCNNGRTTSEEPETDLDCGGDCARQCAEDQKCKVNSDCAAKLYCTAGVCSSSHCADGVRSGNESGVDCGGSTCAPCATGVECYKERDCASKACKRLKVMGMRLPLGKCAADPCTDGQRSPGECGIDCGGACGLCAEGVVCGDKTQCASGQSSGFQCVGSTCDNRRADADETDLDCGGATSCDRCAAGKRCKDMSDCVASAPFCSKDGLCARHPCGVDPVVKAIYGLPGRDADVTTRINEIYVGKARSFEVRNTLMGIDPAYGSRKKLTVTYLDEQCQAVTKTVDEGSAFTF